VNRCLTGSRTPIPEIPSVVGDRMARVGAGLRGVEAPRERIGLRLHSGERRRRWAGGRGVVGVVEVVDLVRPGARVPVDENMESGHLYGRILLHHATVPVGQFGGRSLPLGDGGARPTPEVALRPTVVWLGRLVRRQVLRIPGVPVQIASRTGGGGAHGRIPRDFDRERPVQVVLAGEPRREGARREVGRHVGPGVRDCGGHDTGGRVHRRRHSGTGDRTGHQRNAHEEPEDQCRRAQGTHGAAGSSGSALRAHLTLHEANATGGPCADGP